MNCTLRIVCVCVRMCACACTRSWMFGDNAFLSHFDVVFDISIAIYLSNVSGSLCCCFLDGYAVIECIWFLITCLVCDKKKLYINYYKRNH